jgi:DNA polymerase-3 subunit gamma/tau
VPASGSAPAPAPAPASGSDGPDDQRWRACVEAVEKESAMAASALKQAALLDLVEGEVRVQLPPGLYAASVEKRRAEIEAVFARFFGRPTRLALTVGAAAAPAPSATEGAAPGPAQSIAATEAAERLAHSRRVREAARQHPNIQEAARILEGGVEKIEEL